MDLSCTDEHYNKKTNFKFSIPDVLIVDDSEFVNNILKTELEKLQYNCHQALSLSEALQLLTANSYDYIILDLHLPDAYGERLYMSISSSSKAKIIILTSEEDKEVRHTLFKYGALDYILKNDNFLSSIHKIDETIKNINLNCGFNILVIDDSNLVRKQIQMVLEVRNYSVLNAKTGEEGLEFLKNESVDLIILDLELPDINGRDLLNKIQKDPLNCSIPILVLSGTDNPELISTILKEGASDFIQKPFSIEQFVLKIFLWSQLSMKTDEINCLEHIFKEYQNILDKSVGVCKIDKLGVIHYVNKKFSDNFDYTQKELLEAPYSILINESEIYFNDILNSVKNGSTYTSSIEHKQKNGQSIILDITINPIFDIHQNLYEYVITS